jgi:selenophosphate synthetase-related protein
MTALTPFPEPSVPDTLNSQHLQAMYVVAKMKESADKFGVGFVGGFISPDGKKFMMTNMSEEDTQFLLPDQFK